MKLFQQTSWSFQSYHTSDIFKLDLSINTGRLKKGIAGVSGLEEVVAIFHGQATFIFSFALYAALH